MKVPKKKSSNNSSNINIFFRMNSSRWPLLSLSWNAVISYAGLSPALIVIFWSVKFLSASLNRVFRARISW